VVTGLGLVPGLAMGLLPEEASPLALSRVLPPPMLAQALRLAMPNRDRIKIRRMVLLV
jgi:hypothetical protein